MMPSRPKQQEEGRFERGRAVRGQTLVELDCVPGAGKDLGKTFLAAANFRFRKSFPCIRSSRKRSGKQRGRRHARIASDRCRQPSRVTGYGRKERKVRET
jgi:hypothetical protein